MKNVRDPSQYRQCAHTHTHTRTQIGRPADRPTDWHIRCRLAHTIEEGYFQRELVSSNSAVRSKDFYFHYFFQCGFLFLELSLQLCLLERLIFPNYFSTWIHSTFYFLSACVCACVLVCVSATPPFVFVFRRWTERSERRTWRTCKLNSTPARHFMCALL